MPVCRLNSSAAAKGAAASSSAVAEKSPIVLRFMLPIP